MDQAPALVSFLKGCPRPDVDEYFLLMAALAATRATCGRRRAGCILTDVDNHVIATGYNGVAQGLPHCTDAPCPGRNLPSGQGLHLCEALHAEENALIQCTRPNDIYNVYCTSSPCVLCIRRLLNTGARRIVFAELYPHPESAEMWQRSVGRNGQRLWIHRPWNTLLSIVSTVPVSSVRGQSSVSRTSRPSDTDTR